MELTPERLETIPYCTGPISAKIAFVAEAPGASEEADDQKLPLIGKTGSMLRGWLNGINLPPESVYLTNLLKERPPGNKFDKFVRENPERLKLHTQLLAAELQLLKDCNLIVPVGKRALRAICGNGLKSVCDDRSGMKIMSWRGSIIPATLRTVLGKKCIPIIHPAAIARQYSFRDTTILDLSRIKSDSTFPELRLPRRTYHIDLPFDEIIERLHFLVKFQGHIGTDIETYRRSETADIETGSIPITSDLKRVRGMDSIQFAWSPYEGMCVPIFYANGKSVWSQGQMVMLWKLLNRILTTPNKDGSPKLIGQNFFRFDVFILSWLGFDFRKVLKNMYFDTCEGFQCLEPELPANLGFLASTYTREPFYKEEGKERNTKQGEMEFRTYGVKDVCVDLEIAPQIVKELKEDKLWNFYLQRYHGMATPRMLMSRQGMNFDESARRRLIKINSREILRWQSELTVLVGKAINVKSTKQMRDLLYVDMKLPKHYDRESGALSTSEDTLLKLASRQPSKVFESVLKVRHYRTERSNYLKVKVDSDKRSRSSYGFAETGRFTSSKNPAGTGYNHQNWPHVMRQLFVADDEDHVILEADASQAEARVVHYAAGNQRMIEAFSEGKDIHRMTASDIFDKPIDQIPMKDKTATGIATERFTGKRTNHAGNYGMKSYKFAMVYNKDAAENSASLISVRDADIFMKRFHAANPEIEQVYQAAIIRSLKKEKIMWNPHGRRMVFHDRLGPDLYRQGFAWFPQSTIGDLVNIVFERVYEKIRVINQGHDSLICHVRKSFVAEAVKIIVEASQIPIHLVGGILIVPWEFKVGPNWMALEDYEL